jgi:ABC-type transport system substrate-binding protein
MAAAQLLQSQYQRFSQGAVTSELKFFENAIHISLQSRGEFDVGGPAARGGFIEPDQIFQQVYHSNGSLNFGKYNDPTADQMIEKQRTIFDGAQRKAAVKEILSHLIQNAPYTGWASNSYLNVVQPHVRNFFPEHRSRFRGSQYESIWLDL